MSEGESSVSADLSERSSGQAGRPKGERLCAKFFSIHGCAYGDECHFLHTYRAGLTLPSRPAPLPYVYAINANGMRSNEKVKTRLCRHFESPEGCRYGERCFFAHGQAELRSEAFNIAAGIGMNQEGLASAFKQCVLVPVPQAHVGTVVGKAGSNIARTSAESGAKVSMLSAEFTSSEGSRLCRVVGTPLDVQRARDMIEYRLALARKKNRREKKGHSDNAPAKAFKRRICASWLNDGTCPFGESCHFAHGEAQLQKSGVVDEVENVAV